MIHAVHAILPMYVSFFGFKMKLKRHLQEHSTVQLARPTSSTLEVGAVLLWRKIMRGSVLSIYEVEKTELSHIQNHINMQDPGYFQGRHYARMLVMAREYVKKISLLLAGPHPASNSCSFDVAYVNPKTLSIDILQGANSRRLVSIISISRVTFSLYNVAGVLITPYTSMNHIRPTIVSGTKGERPIDFPRMRRTTQHGVLVSYPEFRTDIELIARSFKWSSYLWSCARKPSNHQEVAHAFHRTSTMAGLA